MRRCMLLMLLILVACGGPDMGDVLIHDLEAHIPGGSSWAAAEAWLMTEPVEYGPGQEPQTRYVVYRDFDGDIVLRSLNFTLHFDESDHVTAVDHEFWLTGP